MQKKSDPRHQKRVAMTKKLFAYQFHKKQQLPKELKEVIAKLPKIDKLISNYAPERPLEEVSPMDLVILRLATYELLFEKTTPYKVVIDEAVEIAKEFGSENSYEFVNGVLGTMIEKELKINE